MSDTSSTKRRTRTRTSHSKGGCITCKVRHLKCDQAKPTCMRCSNAGWQCNGYAQPKPPPKPSRQIRTLAPKNISSQTSLTVPKPALRAYFHDDTEFQCFDVFRTNVATHLSSFLDDSLWEYVVSQTTKPGSPVSNAAIAFGAWSSPGTLEYNREYAFAEYGKALSFLRFALSNSPEKEIPTRQVVVTLLLCVNFEVLVGFAESATQLTVIGINFLQNTGLSNRSIPEITSSRFSPMPSDVENDMINASAPLDICTTAFHDTSSTALSDMYKLCSQNSIERIPETSSKLKEAYLYLGLLIRRTLQHLEYIEPFSMDTTIHEIDSMNSEADTTKTSGSRTMAC